MTGTLKIKNLLGLSLLFLTGAVSNPIKPQKELTGGELCDSSTTSFWRDGSIIINPNVDKYASGDSYRKFKNNKGDVGFSCSNRYKYVRTYNLDQSALNGDFNYYHNSTRTNTYHYSWESLYSVNGTCTEVAASNIVLSHETDIGYSWHQSGEYSEAYYLFYNAVRGAVGSGAMKSAGDNYYEGTWNVDTDIVLTKTLYEMYEKYYGKSNIVEEHFKSGSDAYNKCKEKIDQGKACLLSLKKHSVVCKGYEEYEFCWTEKKDTYFLGWKTGTKEEKKYKTYRYLAIDLGWGRYNGSTVNTRGSYDTCSWISEDNLSSCTIVNLK